MRLIAHKVKLISIFLTDHRFLVFQAQIAFWRSREDKSTLSPSIGTSLPAWRGRILKGVDVASTGVVLRVRWKDRNDGDWVKKTEKAEQAESDTEYFRLFPGFRSSGND